MAKGKGKSKGKKKFKALAKNAGKNAKEAFAEAEERQGSVPDDAGSGVSTAFEGGRDDVKALHESAMPHEEPAVEAGGAHVSPSDSEKMTSARSAARTRRKLASMQIPDADELCDLADLFKVFADPTRLRILYSLMDGGKCVADISVAAEVSQSATSHQLRSMKQAHIVKFTRMGKQVIYSLANDGIQGMLAQGVSIIEE